MTWTPERHAQARARADAATDEPWDHFEDDWGSGWAVAHYDGFPGRTYIAQDIRQRDGEADAEFIAHARTDVPDMLDEIDRLTRALEDARAVTPEMVDRAAREIYRPERWDEVRHSAFMEPGEIRVILAGPRARARAALEAALNPEGEE